MYGSTSPQYSMIASLEVATKMMDDNGEILMNDTIMDAIQLRKKVASIYKEKKAKGDWFFNMWQPIKAKYKQQLIDFIDIPDKFIAQNQEVWTLSSDNNWHGFDAMEDNYTMLDPIKLTFKMPGITADGQMEETGIPASIVSNYLLQKGLVVEKTDYYSFLMLHPIGTTRGKHGELLSALFKFKKIYDENIPLINVFPELVKKAPEKYCNKGLKDHCNDIHNYFKEFYLLDKMQKAFENLPNQAMKPSDAYRNVVTKNVEWVELSKLKNRIMAIMLVPYPPGIPIMMGGEIMDESALNILDYLTARQNFEMEFPGYTSDIHGVERVERNGKILFKTMVIKE